jgi:Arc/MetJ-type ribon-helix-helix transcriptional regulator
MKRTTVKISDQLDAKMRQEAERRGMTFSELTREALEAHLGGSKRPYLRAAAGSFSSDEILGSRVEEIIKADVEAGRFPS